MSSSATTSSTTPTAWVTPAAQPPPGQPDINYAPDFDKWQARTAARLAQASRFSELPEGYPAQLTGDAVWDGATLADTYDWTYVLTADQLAEVDRAVAQFKCS